MPFFEAPTSDNGRVVFLKTALDTSKADKSGGNAYLNKETVAQLTQFIPQYETEQKEVSAKLSNRSKEFEDSSKAFARLELYVRDGVDVLKRMIRRLALPAQIFSLYGLPLDGTAPHPNVRAEWLEIAEKFVDGAARATEQGYPAIACPSADEIEAVRKDTEKEYKEVALADREYDAAQAALAELRTQADDLIDQIMAELRLSLRKFDGPSRRRIMRTYGAKFNYYKGEEPDANDIPQTEIPDQPEGE